MHSGSIVQDRNRLDAPTVTYLSMNVCAGNPDVWKEIEYQLKSPQ